MNENSLTEATIFQVNSSEKLCSPTQYESKSKVNFVETVTDDSVAFVKNLNEIITIEESQSTQELYKHIVDIKEELKNQTSTDLVTLPKKAKNVAENKNHNLICADCEEVDILLTGLNYVIKN